MFCFAWDEIKFPGKKPFEMTAATELANEFSIHKSRYEMMIVGKMRSNFDVHPGGQACRFLLQKGSYSLDLSSR